MLQPGRSIEDALRRARSGDTIRLLPGTYGETFVRGLRFSKDVSVVGAGRGRTTVHGIELRGVSHIRFSGMTSHTGRGKNAVRIAERSSFVTISDMRLDPGDNSAIDITEGSSSITLQNSTLDVRRAPAEDSSRGVRLYGAGVNNPSTWPRDIYILNNDIAHSAGDLIQIGGVKNAVIAGNWLHDPRQNWIHQDGVQVLASENVRIEGNRFSAPGPNGPDQAIMMQPVQGMWIKNTRIVNNLILAWRGAGINVLGTTNTDIVNNTSYVNGLEDRMGAGLALSGPNPGLRVWNNIFFKIKQGRYSAVVEDHNCVQEGGRGRNNVEDANFLLTGQFKLGDGSPCANAGAWLSGTPTTDITGKRRTGTPSAGAFEL